MKGEKKDYCIAYELMADNQLKLNLLQAISEGKEIFMSRYYIGKSPDYVFDKFLIYQKAKQQNSACSSPSGIYIYIYIYIVILNV